MNAIEYGYKIIFMDDETIINLAVTHLLCYFMCSFLQKFELINIQRLLIELIIAITNKDYNQALRIFYKEIAIQPFI